MVTCHDRMRTSCNGALQDPVVGLVLDDVQFTAWFDEARDVIEDDRNAREFIGVARKLSGERIQELVEDRLGKNELVPLLDDAVQRRFAAAAWKNQGGYEYVRVEDDAHPAR